MVTLVHRHRRPFVLINALLIVGFAGGLLVAPGFLWGLVGVAQEGTPLGRVMAWYLLTFGVGGVLASRRPERHPIVIALVGLEKVGPALVFPLLYATDRANALLAVVGGFDALMAVVFLRYAWWLRTYLEDSTASGASENL